MNQPKKYYLLTIDRGYKKAANDLACIYYNHKEYVLAEKYFLIAIEDNFQVALNKNDMITEILNFRNKEKLLSKTDKCAMCGY